MAPRGNLGYSKGMASAVYAYESERGNDDITVTLVWASATIRYAETMYARKLRKELEAESVSNSRRPK